MISHVDGYQSDSAIRQVPKDQAAALDRLADVTGRHKQHLVSELLADRLTSGAGLVSVGRVEVTNTPVAITDEVLTLEEAAALFKLPADTVISGIHGNPGTLESVTYRI